ncbi:MAG: carboxypeptidase regulatory-like domain-containing protein [Planctomycetes bacterium]|nr:carboxypeptidase regulatory-like domain-containing protein [Planctomycetota bacterium]MCB9828544.1 carboxypeptidase regulatory-like domain-containing protein [Planctomycetota bacterium]
MLPLLALAVGGALWLLFLGGGGSTPTPTAGPLDPLGGPATDSEGPLTGADSSAGSLTGDREALDEARRRHAAQGTRLELVEGVVVDAGGNPVSAATVTLHERPRVTAWRRRGHPVGRSLLETRSDEAGRFTLRPLPRGDAFTLRAEAAGHATTLVDVPAPGAWVEMRMAPAGSLRLHIVGGSNQPVAEARAVYTTPEGSYDATSDATGFALLAGLPSGVGQLRVTHPGHRVHADPMVGVVAGEEREQQVVLDAAGVLIGRVVDARDERPLTDASVEVSVPTAPTLPPAAPVSTDADGRFEAPDLAGPRDRVQLHVRRAGYQDTVLTRSATDESDLVISLRRGAPIELRGGVYDGDGRGVGGALLELGPASGAIDVDPVRGSTDERGSFVMKLPGAAGPGSFWQVRATTGSGDAGVAAFVVPRDELAPAPYVEVKLAATGALVGTVLDEHGEPAVGAEIRLEPDGAGSEPSARLLARALSRDGSSLVTTSGEGGAFEMFGLPATTWRVQARRGSVVAEPGDPVTVPAHGVATVEIRLVDGARIRGRVEDPSGTPIPGVHVRAVPEQRVVPALDEGVAGRTDGEGEFEIAGLAQGGWRLAATRMGWRQVGGGARVQAGDSDVVLVMEPRGVLLLDVREGGRPFEGVVTIELSPEGRTAMDSSQGGGGIAAAGPRTLRTEDGRIELPDVDPGGWRVRATTRDGRVATSSGTVDVVGGRTTDPVELTLRDAAVIEGRVVDPTSQAADAVAGAWIQAWPWQEADGSTREERATRGSARADDKGRFRIEGLGAGRYLVGVWTRSGAQWSEDVRVSEGQQLQLELVRKPTGRVEVRVADPQGGPVEGARVTLQRAGGGTWVPSYQAMASAGLVQQPADWAAATSTDGSGYANVPLVPPGTWTVVPMKPGWRLVGKAPGVTIPPGGQAEARVVLEPDPDAPASRPSDEER